MITQPFYREFAFAIFMTMDHISLLRQQKNKIISRNECIMPANKYEITTSGVESAALVCNRNKDTLPIICTFLGVVSVQSLNVFLKVRFSEAL